MCVLIVMWAACVQMRICSFLMHLILQLTLKIADCLTLQAALLADCRTPVQLSVSKEQSKTFIDKDKK